MYVDPVAGWNQIIDFPFDLKRLGIKLEFSEVRQNAAQWAECQITPMRAEPSSTPPYSECSPDSN